jgi:cysteine desulfurase
MQVASAKPLYFDYAATTPTDPRVIEKMLGYLGPDSCFYNPGAGYQSGRDAAAAIEEARRQLADLIQTEPAHIIWTSGATESINLAIKGVAHQFLREICGGRRKHIITSAIEHAAVLTTCRQLEEFGFHVTYLTPQENGLITREQVQQALRAETILVSLAHINNEIGVIQNIREIAQLTRAAPVMFHVDAAQSLGKIPIDCSELNVDFMSFSGHKIYGPKGVGALYVAPGYRELYPQICGGSQEGGVRAGTLPTHQIVGFGHACLLAKQEMNDDAKHINRLASHLRSSLSQIEGICFNSGVQNYYPGILNVSFSDIVGKTLLPALPNLMVSSGAACESHEEYSHVLVALGKQSEATLRISLGRFTTELEVEDAIGQIKHAVQLLRQVEVI